MRKSSGGVILWTHAFTDCLPRQYEQLNVLINHFNLKGCGIEQCNITKVCYSDEFASISLVFFLIIMLVKHTRSFLAFQASLLLMSSTTLLIKV